jgi:hypothetical protein
MYCVSEYDMNPKLLVEYISLLHNDYKKNIELDNTSLGILEQFAWKEYLSAYILFSRLNSMDIKIAYKNVNTRVHKILSSGLIYKVQSYNGSNNKRKAIFYKLTEYGIFQLFLSRINSLLFNQYELRKSQAVSSSSKTFFHNYTKSRLFELFVYPYFDNNTLSAIGDYNLWSRLYYYLEECCRLVESELKTREKYRTIPLDREIFVWNDVSHKEDEKQRLLHFLMYKFKLKDIGFSNIKSEKNTITVTTAAHSAPIILRLNENRDKVIMCSTDEYNQYCEYQYDVEQMGSDIVIVEPTIYEERESCRVIDKAKKELEKLIYEFVYSLGVAAADHKRSKEYLYYRDILSQDKKFMKAVQGIYEKRHKVFENGYSMLMASK